MFERFMAQFPATAGPAWTVPFSASDAGTWMDLAGGTSFDGGLYRVHTRASAEAADALVRGAFPEFADRLACFGFDWLGRQFTTDRARGSTSDPEVLMFDPGAGEVFEIPVPFSKFHDEELLDYSEEALARSFFNAWREAGSRAPDFTECVGYRRPLFLGGQDDVTNLELSDMDVYWTIMGQLWLQVRGQSEGTRISGVALPEE